MQVSPYRRKLTLTGHSSSFRRTCSNASRKVEVSCNRCTATSKKDLSLPLETKNSKTTPPQCDAVTTHSTTRVLKSLTGPTSPVAIFRSLGVATPLSTVIPTLTRASKSQLTKAALPVPPVNLFRSKESRTSLTTRMPLPYSEGPGHLEGHGSGTSLRRSREQMRQSGALNTGVAKYSSHSCDKKTLRKRVRLGRPLWASLLLLGGVVTGTALGMLLHVHFYLVNSRSFINVEDIFFSKPLAFVLHSELEMLELHIHNLTVNLTAINPFLVPASVSLESVHLLFRHPPYAVHFREAGGETTRHAESAYPKQHLSSLRNHRPARSTSNDGRKSHIESENGIITDANNSGRNEIVIPVGSTRGVGLSDANGNEALSSQRLLQATVAAAPEDALGTVAFYPFDIDRISREQWRISGRRRLFEDNGDPALWQDTENAHMKDYDRRKVISFPEEDIAALLEIVKHDAVFEQEERETEQSSSLERLHNHLQQKGNKEKTGESSKLPKRNSSGAGSAKSTPTTFEKDPDEIPASVWATAEATHLPGRQIDAGHVPAISLNRPAREALAVRLEKNPTSPPTSHSSSYSSSTSSPSASTFPSNSSGFSWQIPSRAGGVDDDPFLIQDILDGLMPLHTINRDQLLSLYATLPSSTVHEKDFDLFALLENKFSRAFSTPRIEGCRRSSLVPAYLQYNNFTLLTQVAAATPAVPINVSTEFSTAEVVHSNAPLSHADKQHPGTPVNVAESGFNFSDTSNTFFPQSVPSAQLSLPLWEKLPFKETSVIFEINLPSRIKRTAASSRLIPLNLSVQWALPEDDIGAGVQIMIACANEGFVQLKLAFDYVYIRSPFWFSLPSVSLQSPPFFVPCA